MIDVNSFQKIYFIGIGGIGMSAAAGIAKQMNFEVSGSDSKEIYSPAKDVLERESIQFFVGYDAKHLKDRQDNLFVISAGEDLQNPEVKFVYDKDLPHISFAELLYQFTQEKLRVVVTGTHGKSTTTGLLGHVLKKLDDSSFMTGAVLKNYESNFHYGDGHYFVFEGDEYKAEWDDPTPKFHFYKPDLLVLTNLEYDHPDLFSSFQELESEFRALIEAMPADGLIVYNADDEHLAKLMHGTEVSSVSFGIDNPADFKAENIKYEPDFTTIEVFNKFSKNVSSKLLNQTEQYKTQLPGKLNVYNTLAVIATLRALGFSQDLIALEMLSYQGVKRRFELIGTKNGITLIDDYAHHPTAIQKTLEAARERYKKAKIWAVFEPHTFSRTQATLAELATAFNSADRVLIAHIYAAREKKSEQGITSEQVVEEIKKHNPNTRLVNSKQEALGIIKSEAKSGDVVIVMAVGDFNRLGYELKEAL